MTGVCPIFPRIWENACFSHIFLKLVTFLKIFLHYRAHYHYTFVLVQLLHKNCNNSVQNFIEMDQVQLTRSRTMAHMTHQVFQCHVDPG